MTLHDHHAFAPAAEIAPRVSHRPTSLRIVPEAAIVAATGLGMLLLSALFGLPIRLPSEAALGFIGFHYLVPVLTILAWSGVIFRTRRDRSLGYYAFAFCCYAAVLIFHFNVKLWMGVVNPQLWDSFYWRTDTAVRPLIDAAFAARAWLESALGDVDSLYLLAFVAMFYASFIVHAVRDATVFRKLVIASLLVHALGAFSYLAMPAVGPFVYESGASALATMHQAHMLELHHVLRAEGAVWLTANGSENLLAGLAAMPSLHTAASAVFLYFAVRHERWLACLYAPLFLFILIEALATRWHYLIDLPVGLALAAVCVVIAERVAPPVRSGGVRLLRQHR